MVSIIIPAYKTSQYVEECLDSIQNQDYLKNNEYEIIVGVDGCSETLNKINEIKHKYKNLRIIHMTQNYGLFITFNTLVSLCKYDNIIKFDSDDIMLPTLITDVMSVDADLVRFLFYIYYGKNKQTKLFHSPANGVYRVKKHVYKIFGGYRPWKCAADTEFLQRFSQYGKYKQVYINKPLFLYRQHSDSLTNTIPPKSGSLRLVYHKKFKGKKYKDFYVEPILGEFNEIIK
ncbi:MAG: glycosyltransferase family 2 protein [bacterium]